MFDIAPSEFLLVAFVALVVIGPKDLPKAMRVVGYWVGKARGVARQFRSGFDSMVREAELEEMEKRWTSENERIMREHPQPSADTAPDPEHAVHAPEIDENAAGRQSDHPPSEDHTDEPVMVEKPVVAAAENRPHDETVHENGPATVSPSSVAPAIADPTVGNPSPDIPSIARRPDVLDPLATTTSAKPPIDDKSGKSDIASS